MRRTVAENETARRPHKLINYDPDLQNPNNPIQQIQSNGIWATKARNTTLPVFPTTPVDIARAPCEALYNDGNHTLDFEVTDAANNSNTAQVVAIVDNFKPYIAHVQMLLNNQTIYNSQWDCEACGGIAYHNTLLQSINAADFQQYGMSIRAYTSEPMATLTLNIPFFGLTPSAPANDGIEWIFNVPPATAIIAGQDRSLHFVGNDLTGNNLLNLETFKNNPCVSMPARTSAGVGAIEVDAYTLDYSGGSYDFAWSNGEITTDDIISQPIQRLFDA